MTMPIPSELHRKAVVLNKWADRVEKLQKKLEKYKEADPEGKKLAPRIALAAQGAVAMWRRDVALQSFGKEMRNDPNMIYKIALDRQTAATSYLSLATLMPISSISGLITGLKVAISNTKMIGIIKKCDEIIKAYNEAMKSNISRMYERALKAIA